MVAAATAIAPAAQALKFEAMSAQVETLYAARCQVDPIHAELLKEAGQKLGDDKAAVSALETISKDLKQALTCPYCGCDLALDATPAPVPSRF